MTNEEKVRESRLCRMAKRQGLRLEKSRVRDKLAYTYGKYQLVDSYTNTIIFGNLHEPNHCVTIHNIERFLTNPATYKRAKF